jgi:hypothetical protein
MARKSSQRPTDEEHAERRRQDRERLQQAARELLSSDGWARSPSARVRVTRGKVVSTNSNVLLSTPPRPARDGRWVRRHLRFGARNSRYQGLATSLVDEHTARRVV